MVVCLYSKHYHWCIDITILTYSQYCNDTCTALLMVTWYIHTWCLVIESILSPLLVKNHTYLPFNTGCFIFSIHKQNLTSYSKEPYANFLHLSVNHHFILRVMSHLFILRVNFHLSISRIIHHFSRLRTIPNLLMLTVLPHLTISRGNPLSPNKK